MDRTDNAAGSKKSAGKVKITKEQQSEVLALASKTAIQFGLILFGIAAVLEAIFAKSLNYACWTIYFGILGTLFSVKYAKLHQKHELFLTIVFFAFFVFFFILFIYWLRS